MNYGKISIVVLVIITSKNIIKLKILAKKSMKDFSEMNIKKN
jgi:hypothetical protein